MRALRLLILLLPALAFAGWRQLGPLSGTSQDVVVADAGLVVATGSAGVSAWTLQTDGGVSLVNSLAGAYVGAGLFDGGCIAAFESSNNIVFSPGCGTPLGTGSTTPRRLRVFGGDQLVFVATTGAISDSLRVVPVSATSIPAAGGSWSGSAIRSLQSARVGGIDFHVSNAAIVSHQYSVDGGTPIAVAGTALRDVSPFDRGGLPALVGLTNVATPTLVLFPDLRVATSQPVGLAPTVTARFVSMAAGSGLLSTLTGDLLSPLPDPARVAQVWRARTGLPGLMTDRVNCLDARWCTAVSSTGLVFLYENAAAPVVTVQPAQADAGATVRLFADAGDSDGDPLFLSWTAPGATFTPVAGSEDGFAIDVTVPANAACGPFPVQVTTRDGLHSVVTPLSVEIVGRGTLQALAPSVQAYAGGPAVIASAFLDGGCDSASLSWQASDGQAATGAQFSWTPPATVCSAGGAQVTLTATATWAQGTPANSTAAQQVTVLPWGTPEVPLFTRPAAQVGGTSVTWSPVDSQHACALSGGFPGTELLWDPIDAGALSVTPLDGGLRIDAPQCFHGQFVASARRRVVGEQFGRLSDAGLLVVDLTADVPALGATTPFGITAAADAGIVFGGLSVIASCVGQRSLSAEVSVLDGPTTVNSGVFAIDRGWSLPVPGGCAGGRREIAARLLEDGGFTGAVASAQVDLPVLPVAVGAQAVDRIDARCGVGAQASIALAPVDGACQATETSWRVISGPSLTQAAGTGSTFALQSQASDLSSVGQQLVIEWTVDGGGSNLATERRTIDIGVQPFVEVSVRSSPALHLEESALEFEVSLRNTTACAVQGLKVEVPLRGAVPLPGAVLVDGVKASARVEGSTLVLEDLSLPADGRTVVRVGARARLLATPGAEPIVSLGGLLVSTSAPGASAPTGCGCSSTGSMLAACLLVLARRRRGEE